MKLRNLIAKYGSSMMALTLSVVAMQVASRGCYFLLYQPEEPKELKNFIKR